MKLNKTQKILVAVLVQVLILGFLLLSKYFLFANGTEIILRIYPIDPTDPLRGDYITFEYDISEIYDYNQGVVNEGDTVYIPINKTGKYWYARNEIILKEKPETGLFIKGVVEEVDKRGGFEEPIPLPPPPKESREDMVVEVGPEMDEELGYYVENLVQIKYGIEEYFIPEGVGRDFDFSSKDISAKVVIDSNGEAMLKQVFIDNQPWP